PRTAQAAAEMLTQLITAAQFYQPFYQSIGGQGAVDFDRLAQLYQRQAPSRAPAQRPAVRAAPIPVAAQAQQAKVAQKADQAQATRDAVALHEAMDGWGTDEATLNRIISGRSGPQLKAIAKAYQEMYGESLEDAIKGDTSGDFEDSLLAQLKRADTAPKKAAPKRVDLRAELAARRSNGRLQGQMTAGGAPRVDKGKATRDAVALHEAIDGLGTDEQKLIDVLSNRTNREIRAIRSAYQEMFGESLDDAIKGDTSGDLETMLLTLASGNRDESGTVDQAQATRDAVALHQAIDGWGTDEAALIRILGKRSKGQLAATAKAYEAMYGESLQDAVKGDTSGWFETSLLAQL
ncbi:MAG: annexin, partial [Deltaproteobacteria bacterium]